ncbi:MAG: hypothetical protein QM602_02240 [Microbacterium sp.]
MTASAVFARDTPRYIESPTGRLDKHPQNVWLRWGVRLAVAVLFGALVLWFDASAQHDWSNTANAALAERVAAIGWGTPGVDVISELYPPITSIIAIVVPGGALGLGLAGAAVAGLTLQLVVQSMKRKHFAPWVRTVFVFTLALSPAYAYIVTTNLEAALGLMFFGLGMLDLVRFVTYANTQAGFRSGLLFACSALSDSTGVFAALVAAGAGALIIQSRPRARWANAVVVVFPTLALFGALGLLGIAFSNGPFAMVRGDLHWDPARANAYTQSITSPAGLLYLAPTILVLATAVALGYWGVGLVAVLLTGMTGMAFVLGLTPPGTAGNTFVMMLLLAVAIVPTAPTLRYALLTAAAAVLLYVSGWAAAMHQTSIASWLGILTGAGS